ncbi:MAG: hypothetical protein JHC95_16515 [Solirubrobacteraceae bacterium]|nr:hypothetical protein [Solirubrobacteraceae bacterium]
MRHSVRDATLTIAGLGWWIAMLIQWFGPDDGPVHTIGLVFGVLCITALVVWLVGWIVARVHRDPTALIDARVVLGLGAFAALGAGALIGWLTGSGATGWAVAGVGFAGALYAYVRVAQAAGRRNADGV